MTEKRFYLMNVEDPLHEYGRWCKPVLEDGETMKQYENALEVMDLLNKFNDENEQLKEGMIGVVDRYIRNVDCNPPSSAHTYMKIKGALMNVREDLRDLIEDLK